MSWGSVYLNVDKLTDFVAWLEAMELRIHDWSPVTFDIAGDIRADVIQGIETEGTSIGEVWAPHAEATVERWGEHPLLQLPEAATQGMLINRIHAFSHPFSAGAFTDDPVMNLMEHGTEHMPRRDPFTITEARQDASIELLLDYALGEGKFASSAA